ncbi:MAG: hypothetical protein Q4E37_06325 [Tissierellia bacterium]|nr:hypothetical protein [Tissierellia bacterium]
MDMFGIKAPLYVKRNGKLFLGRLAGYCRYAQEGLKWEVTEIGVVDRPSVTAVFSTTVYECMHAKMASRVYNNQINMVEKLNRMDHEGMVDLAAFASLKKNFGYEESSKRIPSYFDHIVDVHLKLSSHDAFKEKHISETGATLANAIYSGNDRFLSSVADHLSNAERPSFDRSIDVIEKAARKASENRLRKDPEKFEQTGMGKFVEMLKSGLISNDQALNSPQYRVLASILVFEILEEEEEELRIPF